MDSGSERRGPHTSWRRSARADRLKVYEAFQGAGWSGKAALILGTWFGAGLSPWVPGTCGSLTAVPVVLLSGAGTGWSLGISVAVALTAFWSADRCQELLGSKDPSQVVIDEVIGMLVTLFLVPLSWLTIGLGFFLFRLFDVVKPWPVRQSERLRGGLGIVADDMLAGLYAHLTLTGILWLTG